MAFPDENPWASHENRVLHMENMVSPVKTKVFCHENYVLPMERLVCPVKTTFFPVKPWVFVGKVWFDVSPSNTNHGD